MRKTVIGLGVGLVCAMLGAAVPAVNMIQETKEEQLLSETPLKNYSYWYGLDHYPKDKVEMASEVEILIANGMEVDAACQQVINKNSDKIYNETIEFFSSCKNNWDDKSDNYSKYIAYVEKTQN